MEIKISILNCTYNLCLFQSKLLLIQSLRVLFLLFRLKKLPVLGKAELLQKGIFFLVRLFARDFLVMKKLEIEKTKPTLFIPVLKVEY